MEVRAFITHPRNQNIDASSINLWARNNAVNDVGDEICTHQLNNFFMVFDFWIVMKVDKEINYGVYGDGWKLKNDRFNRFNFSYKQTFPDPSKSDVLSYHIHFTVKLIIKHI